MYSNLSLVRIRVDGCHDISIAKRRVVRSTTDVDLLRYVVSQRF